MIVAECSLQLMGAGLVLPEIEDIVGVKPTSTDFAQPKRKKDEPQGLWVFDVEEADEDDFDTLDDLDDFDDQPELDDLDDEGKIQWVSIDRPLEILAHILEGREDAIRAYCQARDITVTVEVLYLSSFPALPCVRVAPELMATMSRLGATLLFEPHPELDLDDDDDLDDESEATGMSVNLAFSSKVKGPQAQTFREQMKGMATKISRVRAVATTRFGDWDDPIAPQLANLEGHLTKFSEKIRSLGDHVEIRVILECILEDGTEACTLLPASLSALLGDLNIDVVIETL